MRYLQLDVFSERAGCGNPLGVVIDADGWHGDEMQAFAAWTNLVETTFLLAPSTTQADYRLRIFTPKREIAFAGHPAVGSAHAALQVGRVALRDGQLIQECGAGLLPIRAEDDGDQRRLLVQAPHAHIVAEGTACPPALLDLLDEIDPGRLPPALVEGGRRWCIAEFDSEAQLRAWRPDHAAIAILADETDSLGLCAFARSTHGDYELVVRAFPCGVGILEDPASGAANGLIGAYIAQREAQGPLARGYRVSQGREIGRDARIVVRVDADSAIWVGGRVHTVVDGQLAWPLRG